MNAIVVYYSLEGHAARCAQAIAQALGAETLELTCVKPYPTQGRAKFLRSSKDTLMGARPALAPYDFDASAYDTIVLGAPCWAGRPAAPLNTFLHDHNLSGLRRAAFITCKAEQATEKYAQKMRATCQVPGDLPVLGICEKQMADASAFDAAIDAFAHSVRA